MSRTLSLATITLLLLPATLQAGGPPWLCLPIDGVTSQSAQASADKLTAALEDKLWKDGGDERAVKVVPHGKQWYLTFPMDKEVALAEVEAALKGSRAAIPRERLHLFGHVVLEIELGKASAKELLSGLEAIEYVSVAEPTTKGNRLLVTADMPYPDGNVRRDGRAFESETFRRNDFSSDRRTISEPPAKASELPSFGMFRDVATKHGPTLKDVRWSPNYACRELGGVGVEETKPVATTGRSAGK
jgi:hypothetical protein